MDGKWKLTLIGALALGLSVAGCVDEEASVVMHTNIVGDGSFDEGDEDTDARASCDFSADFDEPSVWTSGSINLSDLQEPGQQLVRGIDDGATPYRYMFRTVMENRLSDSRTVGAVSGGDGDGFQNLDLDKNDILITEAEVTLQSVDGDFGGTVIRRGTMLVQSGGGVAAYGVPLIDGEGEWNDLNAQVSGTEQFIAEIQLRGNRLSGDSVESNVIEYPLTICDDCEFSTNPQCEAD